MSSDDKDLEKFGMAASEFAKQVADKTVFEDEFKHMSNLKKGMVRRKIRKLIRRNKRESERHSKR